MEFVCNLMTAELDPVIWARAREAEGWDLVAVADHLTGMEVPYPHVWATCGAIAVATRSVRITTCFANNLLRSPVEVGQAARSLQLISGGRFELGLGAGWMRAEHEAAGLPYPEPRERAGRFIEAAQILRQVLDHGEVRFHGEYYRVDVPRIGPTAVAPPRLIGAVGGPRTVREVTPWCDEVEIKVAAGATRGGELDFAKLATIGPEVLDDLVERVRAVRADIPIGLFVLCGAGPAAREIGRLLPPSSFYSRFFGDPERVADAVLALEESEISRAQISSLDLETFDRLAPLLPFERRVA